MSCAVCQAVGQPLKACSRCKATFYCSVQHQEAHWKTHSAGCRAPLSRVAGSSRARAAPSPRSGGACAPGCDEEHDPLRLDYCGVCLPADSLKPPSLRTGGAEQPEGAVLLSDEEAKMYKELKALIKNIVYSKVRGAATLPSLLLTNQPSLRAGGHQRPVQGPRARRLLQGDDGPAAVPADRLPGHTRERPGRHAQGHPRAPQLVLTTNLPPAQRQH